MEYFALIYLSPQPRLSPKFLTLGLIFPPLSPPALLFALYNLVVVVGFFVLPPPPSELINACEVGEVLANSDHKTIRCKVYCEVNVKENTLLVPN